MTEKLHIPMVGKEVYGFCGGLFGRDFWGPARIEAFGVDWVVVRTENLGAVHFGASDAWITFIEWEPDYTPEDES